MSFVYRIRDKIKNNQIQSLKITRNLQFEIASFVSQGPTGKLMPFLMHALIDLFHDSKSSNITSQADLIS